MTVDLHSGSASHSGPKPTRLNQSITIPTCRTTIYSLCPCSATAVAMGNRCSKEQNFHQAASKAATAGRRGGSQKPGLQQLDLDVLTRVFQNLEPKALALAGLQERSASLRDCSHLSLCPLPEPKLMRLILPRHRSLQALLKSACIKLQQSGADAGCTCRALRTAAGSEQLWERHCHARWRHPNKHLQRAGAERFQ